MLTCRYEHLVGHPPSHPKYLHEWKQMLGCCDADKHVAAGACGRGRASHLRSTAWLCAALCWALRSCQWLAPLIFSVYAICLRSVKTAMHEIKCSYDCEIIPRHHAPSCSNTLVSDTNAHCAYIRSPDAMSQRHLRRYFARLQRQIDWPHSLHTGKLCMPYYASLTVSGIKRIPLRRGG